ncbi:MAG: type VI secretion system baseplate subunit TssK [Alphaproteobacteria bacterium]|nr:type VI secretion system baseplate subunit TssK [Alphaproteobacteria bacterium]
MKDAMAIPPAVQWHEGMLLSPQHFQQASLRSEALLHYHVAQVQPYPWGISVLELDRGLLLTGIFRVLRLEAVSPDGLILAFQAGDGPDLEVGLTDPRSSTGEQTVFLAISARVPGQLFPQGRVSRFRSVEPAPVLDENTGDNPLHIPRLVPNLRLVAGDRLPSGFVGLPLARVIPVGSGFALTEYIPPRLSVPETSDLGALAHSIVERVRSKALVLAARLKSVSVQSDLVLASELRNRVRLLISALPMAEALLRTGMSHPFPLYLALCNMLGQLSAVSADPAPLSPPKYDHDDLFSSFAQLKLLMFRLLEEGVPESFHIIPFVLEDRVHRVRFEAEWVGRPLVLGVRVRGLATEADVDRWVFGTLIGSERHAEMMRSRRIYGVKRRKVLLFEDLIPPSGTLLYELTFDGTFIEPGEALWVFLPESTQDLKLDLLLYVKKP